MDIQIIETGSSGNLNIIEGAIAIDMGVAAKTLAPWGPNIEVVMISHEHSDHLNTAALNWFYKNKRHVLAHSTYLNASSYARLKAKAPHLAEVIDLANIIGPAEDRQLSVAGRFWRMETYLLEHNVENQGFILTNPAGQRLIHATDTSTMEHAPDGPYDFFLVEGNYDEQRVWDILLDPDSSEARLARAQQNFRHLSVQACHAFILSHAHAGSVAYQLHESEAFGMRVDLSLGLGSARLSAL